MWLVLLHLGGVVVVVVEEEPQSTTRLQPFLPRQLGSSQTSGGCLLVAPGQLGAGGGAGAAPPPPPPHGSQQPPHPCFPRAGTGVNPYGAAPSRATGRILTRHREVPRL